MDFAVIKIILASIFVLSSAQNSVTLSDEKRLIKHLTDNYERVGRIGRPVFNASTTINLRMGLALIQILDVDEVKQTVTISAWQRYTWEDVLLKWSPEDFARIDHVRIPPSLIWRPDVVLYNNVDKDKNQIMENPAMAVVSSDGQVLWIPNVIVTFSCSMDLMNYPHDTQHCKLKYGSWTYDGFKMDINFYDNVEEIDINDYIRSNEWQVVDYSAKKNVKYYPCCEEPYPDITFSLTIKRLSGATHFSLSHTLIGLVLLVSFFLPPKSTTKLHIAMFVFAINMFLMFAMVAQSPATWIPHLVYVSGMGMILSLLSMTLSTITINLANKGRYNVKLPKAIKTVCVKFLGLLCCLCYKPDDKADSNEQDWEIFAMVLDRLFFIIYLLIFIIYAASFN